MITRPISCGSNHPFNRTVLRSVENCLGSLIAEQMYHGVSSGNSTLLTGQYDDESTFDVDPACDMSTDRFDLRLDSHALHADSSTDNSE